MPTTEIKIKIKKTKTPLTPVFSARPNTTSPAVNHADADGFNKLKVSSLSQSESSLLKKNCVVRQRGG